jgi:serine/threonine protein kinase
MRIHDERECSDAAALFGGLRSAELTPGASGPCLSEELVLAFSEGRSAPQDLERLHVHLDSCGTCLDLVNAAVHRWDRPPAPAAGERPWLATFGPRQKLARRYRIESLIGRGGMGEVYLAFDELLGERVALKMPLPTLSDSPAAIGRLLNEARLARRISHPNVCRLHDVGVHEEPGRVDDRLYFVTMQYIEGERLGQLARSEPLDVASALELARQILTGLGAAHAAGVLHRDLKSDNIMVGPVPAVPGASVIGRSIIGSPTTGGPIVGSPFIGHGMERNEESRHDVRDGSERPDSARLELSERRVTIMDFGLSALLDRDDGARCSARERVGSASYMAPEQLHGHEVGPATDLFAFGVVLFEMLCGTLPFASEGSTTQHALRRVGEPIAPSSLRPDVGPGLDRFVLRCLMEKPEDRFPTAAEALLELHNLSTARASGIALRPWPDETLSA